MYQQGQKYLGNIRGNAGHMAKGGGGGLQHRTANAGFTGNDKAARSAVREQQLRDRRYGQHAAYAAQFRLLMPWGHGTYHQV